MFRLLAIAQTGPRSFVRHLLNRLAAPTLWVAIAALVQCTHPAQLRAESNARPNIVLIMADDMGYECVAVNGGTSYKTPRLDRLAREGMRFTNCHSQPICTPSRVQIMTGLYNHRNYIRFGLLDPKATTFAHVLKKAGYATCIAGKWQLQGGMKGPRRFGFDESCLWQLTRRPGRYPNPGLEINGKAVDYTNGEYGPDIVSDYLCDFMERNKDRPFLAYYPMMLPHWPFEPTPDSDDWDPNAKGVLRGHGKTKYFADMVTYTDKMVGKIVDKLEQLGIRDRTLVIFTGDNGTYRGITSMMGKVAVRGGKGTMLDSGTHVPLIVRWPGKVSAGKVNPCLVDFTDMLPTMAAVAKAELPAAIDFDGFDFSNQFAGPVASRRKSIYCWYHRNGNRYAARQSARTQRYKLYESGKFFDVAADPLEQRPLGELTAEQRKVRKQLRDVIAERSQQWTRPAKPPAKKKKRKNQKNKNRSKKEKKGGGETGGGDHHDTSKNRQLLF